MNFKIRIISNCEQVIHRVEDIKIRARQDFPQHQELRFQVHKVKERYTIMCEDHEAASPTPEKAITYLYGLMNYAVRARLENRLTIHCGSATFNQRQFIVVGDKWAGKTTLICKLMFNGIEVHGDEYVVLEEQHCTPYPRKFHIKDRSLPLLPQLASICQRLRSYPANFNGRSYFVDPLDAGRPWEIRPRKLDSIFYLEPNHGNPTRIREIPKWKMARYLMKNIDNFSEHPGPQIHKITTLLNQLPCYSIQLGDLDQALNAIKVCLTS